MTTGRVFRDAPPWARCKAAIRLKDGSGAQCGRWENEGARGNISGGSGFCTQHFNMFFEGKPVRLFLAGYPLATMRKR